MKGIIKDAIILFVITLVAGVLLGIVHDVTLEPIAQAKANAAAATYKTVLPEATSFEESDAYLSAIEECNADSQLQTFGKNVSVNKVITAQKDGEAIGYVIVAQAKGYGGAVEIAAGINNDGIIQGLGFLTISETPGLGMRAKEPEFTAQFVGMEDPSQMQAISGATYTSKAVSGGLQAAKYFFENYTE